MTTLSTKMLQAFGATLMLVDKTKVLQILIKSPGATWLWLSIASTLTIGDPERSTQGQIKKTMAYRIFKISCCLLLYICRCRNIPFYLMMMFIELWQIIVTLEVELMILFSQLVIQFWYLFLSLSTLKGSGFVNYYPALCTSVKIDRK